MEEEAIAPQLERITSIIGQPWFTAEAEKENSKPYILICIVAYQALTA